MLVSLSDDMFLRVPLLLGQGYSKRNNWLQPVKYWLQKINTIKKLRFQECVPVAFLMNWLDYHDVYPFPFGKVTRVKTTKVNSSWRGSGL